MFRTHCDGSACRYSLQFVYIAQITIFLLLFFFLNSFLYFESFDSTVCVLFNFFFCMHQAKFYKSSSDSTCHVSQTCLVFLCQTKYVSRYKVYSCLFYVDIFLLFFSCLFLFIFIYSQEFTSKSFVLFSFKIKNFYQMQFFFGVYLVVSSAFDRLVPLFEFN